MSFPPNPDNPVGRMILEDHHVRHKMKLKEMRPALDNREPYSYKTGRCKTFAWHKGGRHMKPSLTLPDWNALPQQPPPTTPRAALTAGDERGRSGASNPATTPRLTPGRQKSPRKKHAKSPRKKPAPALENGDSNAQTNGAMARVDDSILDAIVDGDDKHEGSDIDSGPGEASQSVSVSHDTNAPAAAKAESKSVKKVKKKSSASPKSSPRGGGKKTPRKKASGGHAA
eukprot:GFYU01007352.1.p1 GENE.GFYU01007352.1~~GFYU01007352.1.p1  ORF type:complete len:228 (-),score=51.32 GFYU01007352.1:419-1102(-)